jgi:predicted helicase
LPHVFRRTLTGQITRDPNRPDDEQYIVLLVERVITISLETREIVANLPLLSIAEEQ